MSDPGALKMQALKARALGNTLEAGALFWQAADAHVARASILSNPTEIARNLEEAAGLFKDAARCYAFFDAPVAQRIRAHDSDS